MRSIEILIAYHGGSWTTDFIDVPENLIDKFESGKDVTSDLTEIYNRHLSSLEKNIRDGLPDIALIAVYSLSE